MIDPLRQEATFFRLGDNSRYHPAPPENGTYQLAALPGFRLTLDWPWQRPLPPVAEVQHRVEA